MDIANGDFYEPNLRRKDGRYYIRFYDPNRNPQRREISLRTSDKAAAETLFQKRRFEYLHGVYDPWNHTKRDGIELQEAIMSYLNSLDVRASTLKSKRVRLEPFAEKHPSMRLVGVSADQLKAHCCREHLKPSTQHRYLYEFRQFFGYCRKKGWIQENPAQEAISSIPKRKRRQKKRIIEYLQPEEVQQIIEAIRSDVDKEPQRAGRAVLIDVIRFAVYTGLRRGEICNLKWRHVKLYDPPVSANGSGKLYGWINVVSEKGAETKTGDSGRVPIVPQCYELLLSMQEVDSSGYVFEGPVSGDRLNPWWLTDIFKKYRRGVGIREEIHFHSLRHTCASWLAEAGTDLKVIQEVMRHSTLKQTLRYAHLGPQHVSQRMNEAFEAIHV